MPYAIREEQQDIAHKQNKTKQPKMPILNQSFSLSEILTNLNIQIHWFKYQI